jgi:hypothetical protein
MANERDLRGENRRARPRTFLALRTLAALLVVSVAVTLTGCPKLENTVRDVIAAETGFLDKAIENHRAGCTADPQRPLCVAIVKAGQARNVAIDGLEAYCSGVPKAGDPPFEQGGPCAPVASAEGALRSALINLQQTSVDLKAALQAGGKP